MKPPQEPPPATELSQTELNQAALLQAAVVNIVKAMLREVLPKVFTTPSMQCLVSTVGRLDRTTTRILSSLIDQRAVLEALPAVRGTKVRGQQLKARLSEKYEIAMRANGLSKTLIREIQLTALLDDAPDLTDEERLAHRDRARKTAERAKAAADKTTNKPKRPGKDKK